MNKKDLKIAVVGATGNVGRAMLQILSERGYPAHNISAVASDQSGGHKISYGEDHVLSVESLTTFDFSKVNIGLFSPGGKVSAVYAPKAAQAGCVVIDNTSYFRNDKDIPLIIPEINGDKISDYKNKNIIANPNCSLIQLAMVLKPLHDIARVKRVVVSTYQSVSGAGKGAMQELERNTKSIYVNDEVTYENFPRNIAFNVIPQIDDFMDDGYTKEEWKMKTELQKIMDYDIKLAATCVRVPVFVGHSLAATVEFERSISLDQARKALKAFPGIDMPDYRDETLFMTPAQCAGDDLVYVSRLRVDDTVDHGLSMWIVADNVRKGAALNAIQIMELLFKN